jgi:GDP-L-fucose synthase
MVGSAFVRLLQTNSDNKVLTCSRSEIDLRNPGDVQRYFESEKPDIVILAAAKVGGIQANRKRPADFIYDNLMIQSNVIHQSSLSGVKQLVFLGSSCVYPRNCPQPMKEEYLLTGELEPTNEAYALAKIAGLRMAQYYHRQYGLNCVCPMPCNLYGRNDSFDPASSHVLSALVRKFVDAVDDGAAAVCLWGTGSARREFLNVDDLARAVLLVMSEWASPEIINVGAGEDVSIRELAGLIAEKVGFEGKLQWDPSKPDGMPRKCLDVSKLAALGFHPRITLEAGINDMIAHYRTIKSGASPRSKNERISR